MGLAPVIDNEVVQHEWQYWDDGQTENAYRGPPTVERELAWLNLCMRESIPTSKPYFLRP